MAQNYAFIERELFFFCIVFNRMKLTWIFALFFLVNACAQPSDHTSMQVKNATNPINWNGRALPENVCAVIRDGATEAPFTGKFWDHHEKGTYTCVGCGAPLFSSETKYESGSGWPSFYDVLSKGKVKKVRDFSGGMDRIEIRCANCDAHLGHLFDDGPNPTGKRYCINSLSMDFEPISYIYTNKNGMKKATFGAGCFWCIEACFKDVKGIISVVPGYAGGKTVNPSYEEVCTGTTGHAEVAQIEFDPNVISYDELLEIFWFVHDPTQLNRQGNDIGTQYRSVIFYHDLEQKELAMAYKEKLSKEKVWDQPIVTEIEPIHNYFEAEKYHHDYFENNPQNMYCQAVVRPKVEKFRKVFKEKLAQ